MSHFTRVRAPGFWTLDSVVDPAEFEKFDANLVKAINGDDGGVWAPAAVIEIGGAGVKTTGPYHATGTATFDAGLHVSAGLADLDGALDVAGNATFGADAHVENDFDVDGNTDLAGTLTVHGTASFQSAVFHDDVDFDAGKIVTLAGTTKTTGDLLVYGQVGFATSGRIIWRVEPALDDADQTCAVKAGAGVDKVGDYFWGRDFAALRNIHLLNIGAFIGARMIFMFGSICDDVVFKNNGGATILDTTGAFGGVVGREFVFIHDGTNWKLWTCHARLTGSPDWAV